MCQAVSLTTILINRIDCFYSKYTSKNKEHIILKKESGHTSKLPLFSIFEQSDIRECCRHGKEKLEICDTGIQYFRKCLCSGGFVHNQHKSVPSSEISVEKLSYTEF